MGPDYLQDRLFLGIFRSHQIRNGGMLQDTLFNVSSSGTYTVHLLYSLSCLTEHPFLRNLAGPFAFWKAS